MKWPVGTVEVAAVLHELAVPLDAKRRDASEALRSAGTGRRTNIVATAVKYRRARS